MNRQFEYQTVVRPTGVTLDDELNKLGKRGWELCGVVFLKNYNQTEYYFKRMKAEPAWKFWELWMR